MSSSGKVVVNVPDGTQAIFKPPAATAKVLERLEKLYGAGDICDSDGDSVLAEELQAGCYTYTTVPQVAHGIGGSGKPSAPAATEYVDHTLEVLQALAQPFQHPIEDSPDGIRQLLNEPLPTRLPVTDHVYDRLDSSPLKRNLVPHRELTVNKLNNFFAYVLLGGTEIRSGSSEASFQVKWDDLTFKPMQEVVNGTGLVVYIDRNRTDPTGTTSGGKRPDLTVTNGELVCDQEERESGDPTEFFQRLSCMSPLYHDNATRAFIVGTATSGNTIAYYALDRRLRTPPVPVVGPLIVNTPDMVYRVLQCSFNILRFAVTVGEERQRRRLSDGLVLGHREESRYLNINRRIEFFPSYVKKTITPFQVHQELGFTSMEFMEKAYAQPQGWGKAWSALYPKCSRAGVYSVQVQPIGVHKLPQTEAELENAIRCVLNGVRELHGMNLVHRGDIGWPNVLYCGQGWFLMDFETVWEADRKPLCMPFIGWSGIPLRGGLYTKECDLYLVGKLLQQFEYESESFNDFKDMLCSLKEGSLLTVEQVLRYEWLLVS